jgi:hypothetical protein
MLEGDDKVVVVLILFKQPVLALACCSRKESW